MMSKNCQLCNKDISEKKSEAKFCNQSCLYKYWYKENRAKKIAYTKNYYNDNKEKLITQGIEWRKNNPDKIKKYQKTSYDNLMKPKREINKYINVKSGEIIKAKSMGGKRMEIYKFSEYLNRTVISQMGNNIFFKNYKIVS
jgi:hypothetical protein